MEGQRSWQAERGARLPKERPDGGSRGGDDVDGRKASHGVRMYEVSA